MTVFYGVGDNGVRNSAGTLLLPTNIFNFKFSEETDSKFARRQVSGKVTDEESIGGTTTRRLTLTQEIGGLSDAYALLFNHTEKTFANLSFPVYLEVDVPAGGGEILIPALTAANAATALVSYNVGAVAGKRGMLAKVAAAPTAAGSVKVEAGKVTAHLGDAGLRLSVMVDRTFTGAKGYGGPGANTALGDLEFIGKVFGNSGDAFFWLPKIEKLDGVSLEYNGEGAATLSHEFNAKVPAGWESCYAFLDESKLVA